MSKEIQQQRPRPINLVLQRFEGSMVGFEWLVLLEHALRAFPPARVLNLYTYTQLFLDFTFLLHSSPWFPSLPISPKPQLVSILSFECVSTFQSQDCGRNVRWIRKVPYVFTYTRLHLESQSATWSTWHPPGSIFICHRDLHFVSSYVWYLKEMNRSIDKPFIQSGAIHFLNFGNKGLSLIVVLSRIGFRLCYHFFLTWFFLFFS